MAVSTKYFPFSKGLMQSDDDRLLEPGRPRAIENLVILKNGRLGMRFDYDALPSTITGGASSPKFLDLHNLGDGLIALGTANVGADVGPVDAVRSAFGYIGQPSFAWRALAQGALSEATLARNVGQITLQSTDVTQVDVAAGGGLVALVWQTQFNPGIGQVISLHVFDPLTGITVFYGDVFIGTSLGFALPRIVFAGTKFWFCATSLDDKRIALSSFDPATGTVSASSNIDAASANAVIALDLSVSNEGTSFWAAFGRVGSTTGVRGYSTAGALTFTAVGPAVLIDAISIFAEATNGTNRVNLCIVRDTTTNVDLYTYVPPTTSPIVTTVNIFTPDHSLSQVGMCIRSTVNNNVVFLFQDGADVKQRLVDDTTHAVGGSSQKYTLPNVRLNSKHANIRGQRFAATIIQESLSTTDQLTHFLYQFPNFWSSSNLLAGSRPAAVVDRLIGAACNPVHLPTIAFDASTLKSYWARTYHASDANSGQPIVTELALVSPERRQSTQMGDVLYIAGGVLSACEGRCIAEAGGFLSRPVIVSAVDQSGGSIPLGTYQMVAVFEIVDSQGNLLQSAPSDVFTFVHSTLNEIVITVITQHSFWDSYDLTGNISQIVGNPYLVIYRTLDSSAGNLTFFREKTFNIRINSSPGSTTFAIELTASNATLSQGAVLYTQGARGELSGPLEFNCPEPCTSLAGSADRILSGGLPNQSALQESRPLFPGEQIEWSEELGFFRNARGQLLAVARFDERRLLFTSREIFEVDGEGVDDNGIGDIGAPRRLPSDVGLYGGQLGWRSMVECSIGLMFQGLSNQIYVLPRGGTVPQPIGVSVQDYLAAFPTITSATYIQLDKTVRFTCNNLANSDSIFLLYDVLHSEWLTEGPFGFPTLASAKLADRLVVIQNNTVKQQRSTQPPAALIPNAWRSGSIHPFGLGQFGHIKNYQFYGEYRGDCLLRCNAFYDDSSTPEAMNIFEVNAVTFVSVANAPASHFTAPVLQTPRVIGDPASFKFTPNQMKCECVRVDFEVDVPFPNVIDIFASNSTIGVNNFNVTLAANRAIGDRVIIALYVKVAGATVNTPAGWNQRQSVSNFQDARLNVFERILDGSEASTLNITWNSSIGSVFVISWTIRNSHPTAPIEVLSNFTTGLPLLTSMNLTGTLTPSWGLKNTRWLSCLSLGSVDSVANGLSATNIAQVPSRFERGRIVANTSATPALQGIHAGLDVARAVASLAAADTQWAWVTPSTPIVTVIAIRPSDSLPSAGLVYHYFSMDVEDAGKSALKSPLQMG